MGKPNDVAHPAFQPQRRHRRFSVRYPVQVKFPSGNALPGIHAVSNNISKNDFVAKMSGVAAQAFNEALHIENKRVLDTTRQINPQGLCRARSDDSDQHGRCFRCGSETGEACPEEPL